MAEGNGNCFARRERLREIEVMVQKWWEEEQVFRAEAGENPPQEGEKFFGNFAFPYMNGYLHLGHAFSLSKLEFAAAFHRLRGANVLLPFSFHCTGMPIKASADKLAREIHQYGDPPVFPKEQEQEKKKKKQVYQWEIMRSVGISNTEIREFQDPNKWISYFPPLAMEDLKAFGLGCDWRRSFVTTDRNPYFDSFVRWQMRKLKSMGKIVKDVRYTIFCPLDGQPCADHDRASGEGVQPQEYTIVKMEILKPLPKLEGKKVFLACATLRAALNLAYQKYSRLPHKPTCLLHLTGYDLIGLPLKSPLSFNEVIFVLPMSTLSMDKGTGIIASVPSDDTSDSLALQHLKSSPALRAKYGLKDEWFMPVGVPPLVEGTIHVGEFAGKKVQEARPLIRSKLLEKGEGIIYCEPEKRVISRSGEECVVALTDQWYITYGEAEWKKLAEECLSTMKIYHDETRHGFEHTLSWLNQWACSRSFGLGTRIPWDQRFLVESLSDSTLYMAYYTVAHHLHNRDMYGSVTESAAIKPEQLTDEVWDYIFCGGPYPKHKDLSLSSLLERMKHEFEYWYPFDLRFSGKDLIQNHLTFCIYNHTAVMPKHHWPLGFRCNGHIMLNSQKMSKSTGNFRTLKQAIEEFSADATRFSLADAGDGVDDANFSIDTSNAAIKRLTNEIAWYEQVLAAQYPMRSGPPSTYADRVFANEINFSIKTTEQNYYNCMFREALKTGFYGLQAARNDYRLSSCRGEGDHDYNRDLLLRFIDVQTRLIAPICPHYAEYVWRKILKKDGFAVKAGWPTAQAPDLKLKNANKYLQDSINSMRKWKTKQIGAKVGDKVMGFIFVDEEFEGWKAECLHILRNNFDKETRTFSPESDILAALQNTRIGQSCNLNQIQKHCMPFLRIKKQEAISFGPQALDLRLSFGEIEVLQENLDLIKREIGLLDAEVLSAKDADSLAKAEDLQLLY